jgi:hypothetical protein
MKTTRDEMRSAMADMERIWAKPDKAILEAMKNKNPTWDKPKVKKGKGKK